MGKVFRWGNISSLREFIILILSDCFFLDAVPVVERVDVLVDFFCALVDVVGADFVRRLDVVFVGVVEVSFSVFFFSAVAVFETLELSFRLVLEEVDEVLLRERVEDAFLGVFWIPLDDELSFAFLGDINHLMKCSAILPLNSVT